MHDNEIKPFTDALTGAMELYDKRVTSMTIQIWWEALSRFQLDAILNAFSRHVQNPDSGQFAPKPADIIRLIEGGTVDRGMHAWSKVDKAVRSVGPYQTVVFDDAIIHKVISEMGGWIKFGNMQDDEWPFTRNEFVKRYRSFSEKQSITDFPEKLIGIAEHANSEAGRKTAPPMLLGDPEKAKQVYLSGGNQNALPATPLTDLKLKRIA